MASEREDFNISGPLHLNACNWDNVEHRRSVAASLVQGVYILERDRQEKRQGDGALAPPWWEFFQFKLRRELVDVDDSSIFGAVYEYTPLGYNGNDKVPHHVIAFRGTITKGDAFSRDLELDIHIIKNELHFSSRFETAIQAVRNTVATFGGSNVWLTGHSLGSAMAMLAGKTMAKTGVFLEAFLFNPPFFSAPIERIKDKKVKHGIRIATSVVTAGLAFAASVKKTNTRQKNPSIDSFAAISKWVPCLFVNPADHICSEYIGYFEHRKKMEEIGIGAIEKLATQHSLGGLFMNFLGKESEEPMHLIPSAALMVNLTPSSQGDFKEAHGIHQWWRLDLSLDSQTYLYS